MVTRKHLGTGYLAGVGMGLFGVLTSGTLMSASSSGFSVGTNFMVVLSGLLIIVGFTLSGIVLAKSRLPDERVWRVAQWTTVGLGVPTVLIVVLVTFHQPVLQGSRWLSIATINVAGGGIVGILFGTIVELRREYDRKTNRNQRNTVFLRLFRHDIGNSVTAIRGHVDHLASEDTDSAHAARVIHDQIDHVARLSDAARQLDELESVDETKPIDLSTLVHDRLDAVRKRHPGAEIEADIPPGVHVAADDLLASVVENLLTNAVEHNDDQPSVQVTVRPAVAGGQFTELHIRDDGPGFPEHELAVHSQATETVFKHSSGIGLWLTQWIVESYDGVFSIENTSGGGAVVTVKLPRAHVASSAEQPNVVPSRSASEAEPTA